MKKGTEGRTLGEGREHLVPRWLTKSYCLEKDGSSSLSACEGFCLLFKVNEVFCVSITRVLLNSSLTADVLAWEERRSQLRDVLGIEFYRWGIRSEGVRT
ncbi:hypothetical protein E2C01_082249 [Portunus trituberculatus]|uniref:Uncharacterized protein n=1 Tax=Portunus trituberculatus TaxID=210409 RepID=A0A5B7J3A1_PORTR|nr:hypothetical protein [Portunus trituberculatus]